MTLTQTLSAQWRRPTGALGHIAAWTMPLMFRSLYARVGLLLDVQPDDTVLDVACGGGAFLRRYASHARHIAGIDHSDVQLDMARRLNRDRVAAGTAEFVRGDAAALPWEVGEFTAVTCNCLHCFDAPERALSEMRRVLRAGGRVVVAFQARGSDDDAAVDRWGTPRWTEAEVRTLMAASGLSDVSVVGGGGLWLTRAVRAVDDLAEQDDRGGFPSRHEAA